MIETWMKLDNWGNPIPESVFFGMEQVEFDLLSLRHSVHYKSVAFRQLVENILSRYLIGDKILYVTSSKIDWQQSMGS